MARFKERDRKRRKTAVEAVEAVEALEDGEHSPSKEPEGPEEKCPLCQRIFGHWGALAGHLRYHHLRHMLGLAQCSGEQVECPNCPQTFASVNQVLSHVYTEHRNLHFPPHILPRLNRCEWKKGRRS